jgi:hypothetical protein
MTAAARYASAEAEAASIPDLRTNAFQRVARKAASVGEQMLAALAPFGAAVAALYPVAIVAGVVVLSLTLAGPAASA